MKLYESGRYISISEAIWRIFEHHIQESYLTVFHLAVHLENGQRVHLTSDNRKRFTNPSQTTLLAFFDLCKFDNFAKHSYTMRFLFTICGKIISSKEEVEAKL